MPGDLIVLVIVRQVCCKFREREHRPPRGGGARGRFFFFTLVAGPSRSLSLKLSDTRVYEP